MVEKEIARARAEECRKIARSVASTPIAKENWERLAQQWEAELERHGEQSQSPNTVGETGSGIGERAHREF